MKILFDTSSKDTEREVMFTVDKPIEIRFWGGDNGDKIQIYALLVDPSNPQFQLQGCEVKSAQYVPSPIAQMEFVVCGKKKLVDVDERMIYISRTGWYKAVYTGTGIGESIVDMEERNQTCECC